MEPSSSHFLGLGGLLPGLAGANPLHGERALAQAKAAKKRPRSKAPSRKKASASPRSKPVGRPKLVIDLDEMEEMARVGCTQAEMAGFFGCSTAAIEKKLKEDGPRGDPEFVRRYRKAWAEGKLELRKMQHASAVVTGDSKLLVHLGKARLGQNENVKIELSSVADQLAAALARRDSA